MIEPDERERVSKQRKALDSVPALDDAGDTAAVVGVVAVAAAAATAPESSF